MTDQPTLSVQKPAIPVDPAIHTHEAASLNVRFFLVVFLMLLPRTIRSAEPPAEPHSVSFTWNGKPVAFDYRSLRSLGFDRDDLLVGLDGPAILVDPATSYAFVGDPDKDGKLYLEMGGRKQLVALIAHDINGDDGYTNVDPFVDLRAADMKNVRAICLDSVPSKHALELLRHVNPTKTLFLVTENAAGGDFRKFPAIPNTAQFLVIHWPLYRDADDTDHLAYFSGLRSFKSLIYLEIHASPFDVEAIANNQNLVYLRLSGDAFENIESLGQLRALRHLDLSWCSDVAELRFLSGLANLRELCVPHTQIEDLTPLEGLKNIASVDVTGCPVNRLPTDPFPSLRALRVVGTQLTQEQVAQFKKTNPGCLVYHGWDQSLHMALHGVDRIRVRSGGTCHRVPEREQTLFEIKQAAVVRDISTRIVLEPSDGAGACMCCGNPSFEFYRQGRLVVTLGFHHGRSLRWMDGAWPGDALLAPASADFLCRLLAAHGVTRPLEERDEEQRRMILQEPYE